MARLKLDLDLDCKNYQLKKLKIREFFIVAGEATQNYIILLERWCEAP